MTESLRFTLYSLYFLLNSKRRLQLLFLLILMLLGAFAEAISLGAILPFLAILVDPQQALQNPIIQKITGVISVVNIRDLRWQFTLLFGSAAVAAGFIRFMLVYVISRLNFAICHELVSDIYRKTLYQSYDLHVSRNSSEIMGGVRKVDEVVWVIFGLLNMIGGALMGIFIVFALLLIDIKTALSAFLILGAIYSYISLLVRKRLTRNSMVMSLAMNQRIQIIQEGLGGIRDILLDHTQEYFLRRFVASDLPMRQAQASNNIIGPSPRFVVEAFGIVLIAFLGFSMSESQGGIGAAIPTLGALVLGVQRLMPLIQQTYQGWAQVSGNRQLLSDVVNLLRQPIDENRHPDKVLSFDREISFEKISFRYQPHLPLVLTKFSLVIPKGSRVGIVGSTGCGKSTAMDLLMGLLQPTDGCIRVDGVQLDNINRLYWQRNVTHVPQSVYLSDASFAENIAFGISIDQIDMDRVKEAAKQAQISEFIESSPNGFYETIGERGVRLSGGQRQRIGIARAIYKKSKLLVFDEATNALDGKTEDAVISAIMALSKDLTIVMIAHRIGTLRFCDKVVKIDKTGKAIELKSFNLHSTNESKEIY